MFYQFALMPKITQYGSSDPKYLSEENICWGMLIVAHLSDKIQHKVDYVEWSVKDSQVMASIQASVDPRIVLNSRLYETTITMRTLEERL